MHCIAPVAAILGEGPCWVVAEQALYWVDIVGGRLWRWRESDGVAEMPITAPVCSLLPRVQGGYIGGGHDGLITVTSDWVVKTFWVPEPELADNRMNDGKIDRAGRLWAGSMDGTHRTASGSLYRINPDLTGTRVDSGYGVTNGPAFSPDGQTMYHTDSAKQAVYAFPLAADGSVGARRVFRQFGEGEGFPDGMTVDAEGHLWIAFWDGWCVRRLSPAGEVVKEIPVPVQRPTSCAFGGPALDQLFITSARADLTEPELANQPEAGGLFVCDPGVTGIAEMAFAG